MSMHTLTHDLRYALRQLRKSPGYALTAILTLAICIGANAAIFTLIDDAMLRSLPVARPGELVTVGFRGPKMREIAPLQSLAGLAQLRTQLKSVQQLSGWSPDMLSVPDDQGTLRSIAGEMVTGDALNMLGLKPFLGRLLTPADDVPGGPQGGWPAVLGYGFWQANFHGDPGIIGRQITVSGQPTTVVGVLPRDYEGIFVGMPERLMLPMHFLSAMAASPELDVYRHPENSEVMVVGRLAPGSSLRSLHAELAAISPAAAHALMPKRWQTDPYFRDVTLATESESRGFSGFGEQYKQPLLLLQGIVSLVLLLCCVNLASVQFARVQARQHEFAVRAALGAGRGRILQQCLMESLLLAAIGSLLAGAIAWASTGALAAFLTPAGSGEPTVLRPDLRVFAFTSALAVATTLLFGLAPAFLAGRTPPATLLKSAGTNRRSRRLRQRIFVPAQFALALVLVFAAGLFSQTLIRLRSNHTGFDPTHITMVTAQFQSLKKSPTEIAALYRAMTDDLRASPAIDDAAYTWVTPLTSFAPHLSAQALGTAQTAHQLAFNDVGDSYFRTMHTGLLAGREFTPADRDRSTCMLNQSAARLLLPGGSPLDQSLKASSDPAHINLTCRVIGLVEDARYASLRDPAPPTLYFPACAADFPRGGYTNNLVFMIRSQTVAQAASAYRTVLNRYAPKTGYMAFLPLTDQVDQSLGSERLIATLSNTFAGIALLLSAVGLFGVLALRVHQQTPEFGIRLALGATRRSLLQAVLLEAFTLVGAGTLIGIALAAAGSGLIRRFLYNTTPVNPSVAALSLAALLLVALAAALLPARRAASIDPMQALRSE